MKSLYSIELTQLHRPRRLRNRHNDCVNMSHNSACGPDATRFHGVELIRELRCLPRFVLSELVNTPRSGIELLIRAL